jgi:hypothetical protein
MFVVDAKGASREVMHGDGLTFLMSPGDQRRRYHEHQDTEPPYPEPSLVHDEVRPKMIPFATDGLQIPTLLSGCRSFAAKCTKPL